MYSKLERQYTGDLAEICPKFVAMKGPLSPESRYRPGRVDELAFAPEASRYVPTLHRLGVTCVVCLNEPDTYDKGKFKRAGLRSAHHDLHFDDYTAPPDAVVERFLDMCDREGRMAVDCRAGWGGWGR
jgi:cell division cycle 14